MTEKAKTTDAEEEMFNRRKGDRRAPTPAPVPDAEIIEVMSDAIVIKDCQMRGSTDIRRLRCNRLALAALTDLRSHYHITIKRKE